MTDFVLQNKQAILELKNQTKTMLNQARDETIMDLKNMMNQIKEELKEYLKKENSTINNLSKISYNFVNLNIKQTKLFYDSRIEF